MSLDDISSRLAVKRQRLFLGRRKGLTQPSGVVDLPLWSCPLVLVELGHDVFQLLEGITRVVVRTYIPTYLMDSLHGPLLS